MVTLILEEAVCLQIYKLSVHLRIDSVNRLFFNVQELLGIHQSKVIRMDINSGDSLKTWRYDSLRSWHVNWEVREVILDFEEGKVQFSSLSADCKTVHEFIGGYIFLSMRSQDKNQNLDVELFHKLTGGRT